jgi:hypothetical protein
MPHRRSVELEIGRKFTNPEANVQGDWSLIVTGRIIGVGKEDVDKTGQHQKFFYEFLVRPDSVERPQVTASLPDEYAIRVKDADLHQLTSEMLAVGDRVVMTVRANGPRPTLFYLTAVKKLPSQ